jgi:hypothetical protein
MMKGFWLRRGALAALVLAGAVLGESGCSKKLTVDPGYTTLEGVLSPDARLAVYADIGNLVYAKHEFPPNSGIFVLDSTFTVYSYAPGTVQGLVLDGTAATRYEMMRRSTSGGYAPLKDFVLSPVDKWLQSHWEAYHFQDSPEGGGQPPSYQGRGVISGNVTTHSPLTNPATLAATGVQDVPILQPRFFTFRGDTVPTIKWGAVPGAASYIIQIFTYRGDIRVGSEKFVYGIPAPIALGKLHVYYVALVPPNLTSHKIGTPGAQELQNIPMLSGGVYFFRVSAIDSTGRLIGCTVGTSPDTVRIGTEAYLYSAGAELLCIGCQAR